MSLTDYHEQFAQVYDSLYAERDVRADARYSVGLLDFERLGAAAPHVLDFGCGCGAHVVAFAEMGLKATGFDKSPAMIAQAAAKPVAPDSAPVHFAAGAFSDFCAGLNGHVFDGAVSIFQVFNCMDSPAEMLGSLQLIAGRLAPQGRLLIDLWNGAAVFADDPRPHIFRSRCLDSDSREVIRVTVPQLDRVQQRCILNYRILIVDSESSAVCNDFESVHQLTFLTPLQYRHLFELAGFNMLDEFKRGHPGTPITDQDWYISYLVQKK